jgi:hypothetical protein
MSDKTWEFARANFWRILTAVFLAAVLYVQMLEAVNARDVAIICESVIDKRAIYLASNADMEVMKAKVAHLKEGLQDVNKSVDEGLKKINKDIVQYMDLMERKLEYLAAGSDCPHKKN